ncbi:hypothetical protein KI387_018084, partial [Taxus chinensis]
EDQVQSVLHQHVCTTEAHCCATIFRLSRRISSTRVPISSSTDTICRSRSCQNTEQIRQRVYRRM